MWREVLLRLCPSALARAQDSCTDKCTNTTSCVHNATASKVIVADVSDGILFKKRSVSSRDDPFALIPILAGTLTGTKTNGYQKANLLKFRKLAILKPGRVDTPLGAVKKTPKRVPKQTGTKMPIFQDSETCHFETHPFWYPFGCS